MTAALLALLRRGPGPEAAGRLMLDAPSPHSSLLTPHFRDNSVTAALREEEWTRLVRRAKVHRVAPLIYRRLVTDGLASAVPASAIEFLRDESLRNSLHNMKIFKALGEVLEALNAKGIAVMLLKGVHLAEFYYPDRTLRPMADIDIMVKFADYDEAAAALLLLGFAFRYNEDTRDLHLRYPRHVDMTNSHQLTVELHRTFEPRERLTRIDLGPVWERATPLTVDGRPTFGLAPEDLLLHLCSHMASQDCFRTGLIALSDVVEAIERANGDFSWDAFVGRARDWGMPRSAALVLSLAEELVDAPVPSGVCEALQPEGISPERLSEARSFALTGPENALREPVPLLRLAGSSPLSRKVGDVLRKAFVSRGWLAHEYGVNPAAPWIYFYYPRRIVDLIRRYGKTAWSLARGNGDLAAKSAEIERRDRMLAWLDCG